MRVASFLLMTALTSAAAFAQPPSTGPGAMRCTVVIGRLSSQSAAERMPVLSWVQGYLSGIASARSASDKASALEVPEYDALQPLILTLCKVDPTANLLHVASNFPLKPRGR